MSSRSSFIPVGEVLQKQEQHEYANWATANTTRHASPLRATIMLSNHLISGMDSIENEPPDDVDMLCPWDDSSSPVEINNSNNTYRNPLAASYQDKTNTKNYNSRIANLQRAYYAGKNISAQSTIPGITNSKSLKDNIASSSAAASKNLKKLKETTTAHHLLVPLLILSEQDKKKMNLPPQIVSEQNKEIEQVEGLFQRDKITESSSTCSSIRRFLASSTSPSRGMQATKSAAIFPQKSIILSNVSAENSKILTMPNKKRSIIPRVQRIPSGKNDTNQEKVASRKDIQKTSQEFEGEGENEVVKETLVVDDHSQKLDQQNPSFNPSLSAKLFPLSAPQFILLQKINSKHNNFNKNHSSNNNTINSNVFLGDHTNTFTKNQSDRFLRQQHQQSKQFNLTHYHPGLHETSFKKLFFSRNESIEMVAPNEQLNLESLSLKGKSCKQHHFQLFQASKTTRTISKDRSDSFKTEFQSQNMSQGFARKNIPFTRYATLNCQQQQQQQREIKKQKQQLISSYLGVSKNQVNNEYQQCDEQLKSNVSCKLFGLQDKDQHEKQQYEHCQPLNQINCHPLLDQQFPPKSNKHLTSQECLEYTNNRNNCRSSETLLPLNHPQLHAQSGSNKVLASRHDDTAQESAFCDTFLRTTQQKVSAAEQTDFEACSEVDLYNSAFEIRIPRIKNSQASEQMPGIANKPISSSSSKINPLKIIEKNEKWMFCPGTSSSVTSSSSHYSNAIPRVLQKQQQLNEYNQTQKEESIRSLSETAFQPRSSSLIIPTLHLSKKASKFQYLNRPQQAHRGCEETEDKVQNIYLKTSVSHTERKNEKELIVTEETFNYQQESSKVTSQTERNTRLPLNSILLKHQQAMRNKREKKNNEFKQGILQALSSLKSGSKQ